jgi:peptide/nickel transport system substrate-binding protein
MPQRRFWSIAVFALVLWTNVAHAEPRHAIAMHGEPRHGAGSKNFPYANPDAPKGGRLVQGVLGGYDSLNPFIIKGTVPEGLRGWVYESLMMRSGDETFSLYGLLAESLDVAEDRSAVTFNLRPEARFSDGEPVTPEDVLYSFTTLRDKGVPFFRSFYKKVATAEKIGPRAVRFTFTSAGDREIPMIMGLMPVLPRHRFTPESFERTTLEPPVGSGPYTITTVDPGRALVYTRNPNWWGKDLAVARGRFNFDEIRLEFARDATTLFEAFKAGQIDVRAEDDPGRWAEGYRIPPVDDGRILRRDLDVRLPAALNAYVFNTRKPMFADQRVRQALILLFDAEWLNRALYNGLYKRTQSLFERSELSSFGTPASDAEKALLAPFAGAVRADIMDGTARLPAGDGTGNNRGNLEAAFKLLTAAGYTLRGRHLVNAKGEQLTIDFLAQTRAQERLMLSFSRILERVGIAVKIRQVDSAQYWSRLKSFDFDIIQWTWGATLSPGNEQANRWSSRAAETDGSLNYAGVRNLAADAMIDALLAARGREDFIAAVRAFDRVIRSGDYLIPLFHLPKTWIAHWRHIKGPGTLPNNGFDVDLWWSEGARP